jgi:hypothetical protein
MVRFANKFDFTTIHDLLRHFCRLHKFAILKDEATWSESYVNKQLSMVLAGAGFILISEDGSGFLVALKAPCFFIENTYSLHEIIWHATNDKTSLKLFKRYIEIGEEMKKTGEIKEAHFSCFSESDFSRYGATKLQNTWKI